MTVLATNLDAAPRDVAAIPALQHVDAPALIGVEYERLLDVLEALNGDDWEQPTYCTDWNVRDMVAHLAGAVAAYASWGEFRRQMVFNPYLRTEKELVDGINRRQIEDRAGHSTQALVSEFQKAGEKAMGVRQRLPWPLYKLPILRGEPVGDPSLRTLLDVIYPRDWWMHRYDLCVATGKPVVVTAAHDGRLVELIMLDVAHMLNRRDPQGRSFTLHLNGEAGGTYHFGPDPQAETIVTMDVFDFALISSGRISVQEALQTAVISGKRDSAEWFLNNCAVLY